MKNLLIGLFVLGLTSLGFSQNTNSEVEEVELTDVVLTNVNLSYLENVQDKTMSDHVRLLENQAAKFDVSGTAEFDGRKESFKTIFRGSKGSIIATYDSNGKILNTKEQYTDIKLPKRLIKSVLKQYPNCTFQKMVYSVDYDDQKDVAKTYKIQIIKNDIKTNLKFSSTNNLDNPITMSMDN